MNMPPHDILAIRLATAGPVRLSRLHFANGILFEVSDGPRRWMERSRIESWRVFGMACMDWTLRRARAAVEAIL